MKYYRLVSNMNINDGWLLAGLSGDDPTKYTMPKAIIDLPVELRLKVYKVGKPLNFVLAHPSIPVVSSKLAIIFKDEDVQTIPVRIGELDNSNYFVLVIKNEIDCVDENLSDYQKWEPDNPIRPDLAGEYQGFVKLVIDKTKVTHHHVFRVKYFSQAIIVSQEIRSAIEAFRDVDASFIDVTT